MDQLHTNHVMGQRHTNYVKSQRPSWICCEVFSRQMLCGVGKTRVLSLLKHKSSLASHRQEFSHFSKTRVLTLFKDKSSLASQTQEFSRFSKTRLFTLPKEKSFHASQRGSWREKHYKNDTPSQNYVKNQLSVLTITRHFVC